MDNIKNLSEYKCDGEIEYTYEIRDYNVYFSKVWFNDAQKEGEVKLNEYVL